MKKPLIGYVFLSIFAFILVYDDISPGENVTDLGILVVFAGLASMAAMLIWMSVNLFLNRKKIRFPVLWALFLFFGNWIAVIVYFFLAYTPSANNLIINSNDELDG